MLTIGEVIMTFMDYIAENHVFTTQGLLAAVGNHASIRVALSRATKSGKVIKVRTGLYVSQSGRYQGIKAEPYMIAHTLRADAVFVYHAALDLHGLAHSSSNTIQFMTEGSSLNFVFDEIKYKSFSPRKSIKAEILTAKAYGSIAVTTREQTFVDCMAKVGAAGGTEEVLRSFASLPYVNLNVIVECLDQYLPSVAARVGWYLEANQKRWSVPSEVLEKIELRIPQNASYKLDPGVTRFESYSSRWRVSLPAAPETLHLWMEM